MDQAKDYRRLITSARWLRLRRAVLTAHPLCVRCLAEGRTTAATEVHHIRPVEQALSAADKEQRAYDPTNLQALCHDCHVATHTEMGRSGKAAARKRNNEHVAAVVGRFFGNVKNVNGGGIF